MKKILKGIACAGIACTLLAAVGCKNNKSNLDPETRHLSLATAALDGNFNPFFYTAQNDGNILSHTQISLMTSDSKGALVCGENEAAVALDWSKTKYSKDGQALSTEATKAETDHTTYEFLIKKGIKFSDGKELTIKDVLFNIYVYLDPAYTGSSTMYSTDIRGLNAYRLQEPGADDGELANVDASFIGDAEQRVQDLIDWSNGDSNSYDADDLATVKKLYREEIESDWTSIETSWKESYKNSYRFENTWEAYLFNEGIITVQTELNDNGATVDIFEDKNNNGIKEDGELYYTTLDPNQKGANTGKVEAEHIKKEINDYVSENLTKYMSDNKVSEAEATEALQREASINLVFNNYTTKVKIQEVLTYWATASTVLEDFIGQLRAAHYEQIKNENQGGLAVKTISGITTYKTSTFNNKSLGSEYDVLKIEINGIDPKAEFSFAIPVAPLHYYSGIYKGVDYVATANTTDSFGVDMGNKDFFDQVLRGTGKNGLPVGAGAYAAATDNGKATYDRSEFFKNNIVHFVRNDNFQTVGSGISNAKIKYIDYKVLSDDRIMDALTTKSIDFGTPNATPTNSGEVSNNSKFLASKNYSTSGYGYVGINPKFVPEIGIRRALMKAMDTTQTLAFYGSNFSDVIYRPVSKTSWSDPKVTTEYESIKYTTNNDDIIALVEGAGYRLEGGIYTKKNNVSGQTNAPIGTKLKLTFTLAGESTDHPAYKMFCATRDRLNQIGFDITVTTDIQALKKLNSGNLAIWAAAWSSAIDPDMYQVYHMDSNASSVNNWNYKNILNDTSKWRTEYNIIRDLSDLIEKAREIDGKGERAAIYADCYDLVMDLAVELPTYQRDDLCVYNKTVIDASTLVQEPTSYIGLFDKIWEINYVK